MLRLPKKIWRSLFVLISVVGIAAVGRVLFSSRAGKWLQGKVKKTSISLVELIKKTKSRYFSPRVSLAQQHTVGLIIMAAAFVAGSYFTISEILLPRIRALTESSTTLPTDLAFNRGESGELSGYDNHSNSSYVIAEEVRISTSSAWWNPEFLYKKPLTVKNFSDADIASQSAATAQITLNTKALYDAEKLQDDCDDLRVVKVATDSAARTELPRSIQTAAGATNCSDSTGTIVSFPMERQIATGSADANYEIYYGDDDANEPTFRGGSALSFDGVDDRVLVSNDEALTPDIFTFELWAKINDELEPHEGGTLVRKHSQGQRRGYWLYYQTYSNGTTQLKLNMGDDTQEYTIDYDITGIDETEWHHIAVTFDGEEMRLYFDGAEVGSEPISHVEDYTSFLSLGFSHYGDTSFSNATIDSFRLSNSVRYENNFTPSLVEHTADENTVALLNFNDGSGQDIVDLSDNSFDGRLGLSTDPGSDDPTWVDDGDPAFSFGSLTPTATLVCPFNGTTSCAGGETPSTENGPIRYSGGRSAISTNGAWDSPNKIVSPTLPAVDEYTIEFYLRNDGNFNSYAGVYGGWGGFDGNDINTHGSNFLTDPGGQGLINTGDIGLDDGNWHHIAITYNGSTFKIFRDGTEVLSRDREFEVISRNFYLAARNHYRGFKGSYDELRISDTVRYNGGFTVPNSPFEPDDNTVLLYHFDENGSDPREPDKVLDASGNGNHGTIVGAKYVSGFVGVDSSSSDTGAVPSGSYASHQGVYIEEGTTNLITNPSFEHDTDFDLGWDTNYFNYATDSATFTPKMAKRNSAGPFAAGPMSQDDFGDESGLGSESLSFSRGSAISGDFTEHYDDDQGTLVFWWTPEYSSSEQDSGESWFVQTRSSSYFTYNWANDRFEVGQSGPRFAVDVTAGNTYLVVFRWDKDDTVDGTNSSILTVNDTDYLPSSQFIGWYWEHDWNSTGLLQGADGIVEGLTFYRRVLYDGAEGVDVSNGDELTQLYNSGSGKDPAQITGSWDVTFSMPTNSIRGEMSTGTGEAWGHPHASNLLYTDTTNTGGFMMNSKLEDDGWNDVDAPNSNSIDFNGSSTYVDVGSDASLDYLHDGEFTVEAWIRSDDGHLGGSEVVVSKGSYNNKEWLLFVNSNDDIHFSVTGTNSSSGISSTAATDIRDGKWHHVVGYYNDEGDRKAYVALDGVWYAAPNAVEGAVAGDDTEDLNIGQLDNNGWRIDGAVGWVRISNNDRYSHGSNFTPPSRWVAPETDANTIEQWNMDEGGGTTVLAQVNSSNNGNLLNGTWNIGEPLSPSEQIFTGGYSFTAEQWDGIYRDLAVVEGDDWVIRGLASSDGVCQPQLILYDQTNGAEIGSLYGTTSSTNSDPDNLIFTGEAPSGMTTLRVKAVNAAASKGTCNWHQIELYENQFSNPSFETGSGDPWIPVGWRNEGGDTGEIEQESTIVRSGSSAVQYNTSLSGEGIADSHSTSTRFHAMGLHSYSDGVSTIQFRRDSTNQWGNDGFSEAVYFNTPTSTSWSHSQAVWRTTQAEAPIGLRLLANSGATGERYLDDIYSIALDDVSVNVSTASEANSTEISGLRVDGADTLVQPVTNLYTDRGVAKFKFTPRHSWDAKNSFGSESPYIFYAEADSSNYLMIRGENTNTKLKLIGNFNGSTYTAEWLNPTLNAGTTYLFEIRYEKNNNLRLVVDGSEVATKALEGTEFATVPTTAYFGSDGNGSNQYDGTYRPLNELTVEENTDSGFVKFGSKSVKLTALDNFDDYTIAATASANGSYYLSAYVFNGTSGDRGEDVNSNVAEIALGAETVGATYEDMGGGWWRIRTNNSVSADETRNIGIRVKPGKTVYVDGVQLEHKTKPTTYTDGSLGSGYSWSGTPNESTSTRDGGSLYYANDNYLNSLAGTVSMWFRPEEPFGDFAQSGIDGLFASNGTIGSASSVSIYIDSGRNLMFNLKNNANESYAISQGGWSASILDVNKWHQMTMTWDGSSFKAYINNELYGEVEYSGAVDLNSSNFHIGSSSNWRPARGVISDLKIYKGALDGSELSDLYNAGLLTHTSGSESDDRYNSSGTYTTPTIDLGANGQWGSTPLTMNQTLNGGAVSYFTRTSQDNSTWSEWEAVTGVVESGSSELSIASNAYRYLQLKAEMTAPESLAESPVITGMTTSYVEDTTAPENPDAVALGYSTAATESADLTSGTWHKYATPKFTWESGEDSAGLGQSSSGIEGYHVLLTSDQDATPSANTGDDCYLWTAEESREYVVGSSPANCELSDNTYYLKLQAKDFSGNVADPVQLFTYKFDGSIPQAPSSISTTEIGYQAENTFTFFWPAASDNGPSGISGYEYKTGASDGSFSDWQFTTETSVEGVEAYQEGQNFFYVRTKDIAGNYSGETSNNVAAGSFYFNSSAPTSPRNVVVTPLTTADEPAESNVFTVEWDKPASYSGEIAKYYYCVNCTPSEDNMTETTASETVERTLTNLALASQQGKNTFYIVAEDNNVNTQAGHGNRNFDAHASVDFYASTTAPGAPQNLTISDASNREKETWRLTLAWEVPSSGGTPDHYTVYRSTDGGDSYSEIGQTTSTAYTDADLENAKEYNYKVRAIDNAGSESIFSNVVSETPVGKFLSPPSAGGVPTATAGATTATITWTTAREAYGSVEYGKSTDYGSSAGGSTVTSAHQVKLTGLSPGETYHYRTQSLDESALVGYDRDDARSSDYTFTTEKAAEISNVTVAERTLNSAIITWQSSSLQSAVIEYGLTEDYGSEISVSASGNETVHTARLSGLDHSSTYHFRIKAVDLDGTEIASDDYTLETITFPEVTAVIFNTDQSADGTTATIAWSTNVPTTGTVEYQPTNIAVNSISNSDLLVNTPDGNQINVDVLTSMTQEELATIPVTPDGETQAVSSGELARRRIQRVTGLEDGKLYIFTLRGRDEYGNEAVSEPIRYVTGNDTKPPEIQNLIIETPIIGVGADSKAQIVVSFETDEPAYSQIHWGRGTGSEYPQSTERSNEPTTQHAVILRDLEPTSSYHMVIEATDQTGNLTQSEDTVVVTPTAQEAAFDIILRNLESVFGFL